MLRDLRSLRRGWEAADARARGFEQEAIKRQCAEAALGKEVAQADALADARGAPGAEGRARRVEVAAGLRAEGNRAFTTAGATGGADGPDADTLLREAAAGGGEHAVRRRETRRRRLQRATGSSQ